MEVTRISTADTAKLIRKELKHYFPATKFSVRSHSYSGGSSINVSWVDGPTSKEVDLIVKRFQGASFDGMIDLKEYHNSFVILEGSTLPIEVHYGADFVFTNREFSPEFQAKLTEIAQTILDMNEHTKGQKFDANTYYSNLGTHLDFAFDCGYGQNLIYQIGWDLNASKVGA
jgi:hypothetical protein